MGKPRSNRSSGASKSGGRKAKPAPGSSGKSAAKDIATRRSAAGQKARKQAGPKPERRKKKAATAGHEKASEAATRTSRKSAPKPRGRPRQSRADAEQRRQQILSAALTVFSQHGFEAARLDEVAQLAGVAKGTLYLYFPDKHSMLEALVREAAQPVLQDFAALMQQREASVDLLLAQIFALFRREVLGTRRKLIIRLIIAEGPRFPELAKFYHREVIGRVMSILRVVAAQAHQRGELATEGLVRFPQLIAAPLLLSLIWDGLFSKIDPLDVEAMLGAHAELLTAARRKQR